MSRKITLTLIAALAVTSAVSSASACGGRGGYRSSYRASYYRPVVRQVIHRPVVKQVVHVAPVVAAPAPAPVAPQLPTVPAGSTLTLPANFLGLQPGSVFLVFHNIKLPAQVVKWTNNGVTVTLPPMAIKDPLKLRLDVVLPNGKLGHQQQIVVTAPAKLILHQATQQSPLPAIGGPAVIPAAPAPAAPIGPGSNQFSALPTFN